MFPVKQLVFIDSSYNGLCHVTDLHDIILLLNLIKHDGVSPLMVNMIYVSRLFDTSVDYILVAVIRTYHCGVDSLGHKTFLTWSIQQYIAELRPQ